jgi:hypothetical protein
MLLLISNQGSFLKTDCSLQENKKRFFKISCLLLEDKEDFFKKIKRAEIKPPIPQIASERRLIKISLIKSIIAKIQKKKKPTHSTA